jgi:serine/threonine protein kinase/Flp pilus assembly protein TadD
MAKKQIFGLDPKKLDKLLSIGTEGADIEDMKSPTPGGDIPSKKIDAPSPTVSLGIFAEQPGSQIGRYKLLNVLGEGGMGIVYLAEQEQPIKRQVALKVIKPGMDSARVIARFEAERQALALLDHPNMAHVYDAGTTEAGRPYFVMEYIEGLPITEHCDRHKLTIEDRLGLFVQVCHAVHHAHQKGIIHRDIKPSNILVSVQEDQTIPKIIDFGVAKAISQPLTERTFFTEQGQMFGTPEYMSPEQADMATEDIDTRSDIYALGVLLYVLLTGVLPFEPETLREGGIEHIRKMIRETNPKTPSTRLSSLGDEAKKIAEGRRTEVITLAKCLHRELEWIPSELADDIENYLQGNPLIAGPLTAAYRLKKFVRRNRALVAGIAAILVVLIAGIIVSALFAVGQAHALAEAERQARISEAVSSFLCDDLLASLSPDTGKGRDVTVRSMLDTASENLSKVKNEPLVEARLRDTIGWIYRDLDEFEAAEPHLECAARLRREQLGEEHADTLHSMSRLGRFYRSQGMYQESAKLLEKALLISQRVLGPEHITTLGMTHGLAVAYLVMGRYDEAEQLYLKAIPVAQNVPGEKNEWSLHMVMGLGKTYEAQGRYDEAELQLLDVLRLGDGFWDDENIWALDYKGLLAWVYRKQKRHDEAERLYRKVLLIQRKVDGDETLRTLRSVSGLAWVCTHLGKHQEAEKLFTEALEVYQRKYGREHGETICCMNGLAELYTAQHRYEDAKSLLVEVLEISSRALGEDHPWTLTTTHNLATTYKGQGQYEEAERLLLEAIKGRRLRLGDTHPHTLESWNNLIDLYEAWDKLEKAEKWRAKPPQTEALEE